MISVHSLYASIFPPWGTAMVVLSPRPGALLNQYQVWPAQKYSKKRRTVHAFTVTGCHQGYVLAKCADHNSQE